jgi:hypothetical protein
MALAEAARESADADTAASRVARQRSPSAVAATPPGDWLPRNGWDPETTTLSSWAREQGRKVPASLDESSGGGLMWLVAARRRAVLGNRPRRLPVGRRRPEGVANLRRHRLTEPSRKNHAEAETAPSYSGIGEKVARRTARRLPALGAGLGTGDA